MSPNDLFTILADPTRLRALMLMQAEDEVCVCELTFALQASQPKISRHLAVMREAGIVEPRREGNWMHYRVNPAMPDWAQDLVALVCQNLQGFSPYAEDLEILHEMSNRPEKNCD